MEKIAIIIRNPDALENGLTTAVQLQASEKLVWILILCSLPCRFSGCCSVALTRIKKSGIDIITTRETSLPGGMVRQENAGDLASLFSKADLVIPF